MAVQSNVTMPNMYGMMQDLLNAGILILTGAGAPTNGTSGTGVGIAGPGSLYWDSTNKHWLVNQNTIASPTWNQII